MTPYAQKVKERIQQLVPEVMELRFGCEVESNTRNGKTFFVGRNDIEDENYFVEMDTVGSEDQQYFTEGEIVSRVLGSPLTLAVVLRAIAKEGYNTLDMLIGPSDIAIFRDRVISEDSFEWNLNFDFDLQSEATQAFIGQVLGVEE